jgi:glycosyltransferase involved in cell wall biosynthesis
MRVALLTESFAKGMGYLENILPKYFVRLGVETHVIATSLPMNFRNSVAEAVRDESQSRSDPGQADLLDGYAVHTLGHKRVCGHMRMVGLREKLAQLRPDIVQTMTPIGWIGFDSARYKSAFGYELFTGCHYHASVFPLAWRKRHLFSAEYLHCLAARMIPGRFVSLATKKCYAIAQDCAEVAERFFGVQKKKLDICPLGVDLEIFHPDLTERGYAERSALRQQLGFAENEIICVYTGKCSSEKNPLLLAEAVEQLRRAGAPYRGLFIGSGEQLESIAKHSACISLPPVDVRDLGAYFRAADIGVWPTQESMSMLDAAACGLPVVANNTMQARERLDGNGLSYRLNDVNDLVRVLLKMRDKGVRQSMGHNGALKMAHGYGWESIARRRIRDYEDALPSPKFGRNAAEPL